MALPSEAYPFLDMIASGEATRYDELYGGGTFDDYSRHPDVPIPIAEGPHAGETSTAAGRYQFLASTWRHEADKLGLTDFSPESQDDAAWDLARTTYRDRTGRDLLDDLRAGRGALIRPALAGQWPSLGHSGGFGSIRTGMEREAANLPHIDQAPHTKPIGPLPREPEMPEFKPSTEQQHTTHIRIPRLPHLRPAASPNLQKTFEEAINRVRHAGGARG